MALTLRHALPAQGAHWVREGFGMVRRRPMAFVGLFAAFLLLALLMLQLPYVGAVLLLAAMPVLSMGFMIATRSALQGGPVHPGQYLQALGQQEGRLQPMLTLCLAYAAASVGAFALSDAVDGGTFIALQEAMARGDEGVEEVNRLLADPSLSSGMLLRVSLASLISVPFWHAPALVLWGGQGVAQALFSSALAMWRNKGAFAVYALTWTGVLIGGSVLLGLVMGLLGAGPVLSLVAVPAGLVMSAAFYASLLFTFNDSFGAGGRSGGSSGDESQDLQA